MFVGLLLVAGLYWVENFRLLPLVVASRQLTLVPQACQAFDVVFLIDQSSSMTGTGGLTASDPTRQREFAPEAMSDLLATFALDRCPGVIYRMGLISFGPTATVDLPLTEIAPHTITDTSKLRQYFQEQLIAKDLGPLTAPADAFHLAVDLLNSAPPLSDGGIRKRAVIFLTDGRPCLVSWECTASGDDFLPYLHEMQQSISQTLPFSPAILALENCLVKTGRWFGEPALTQETINSCILQHPINATDYQNSTYIWTILLNFGVTYQDPVERLDAARQIYTAIATSHAGQVIDLEHGQQDIPTAMLAILSQLAGVRVNLLKCGSFVVNPYLAHATFMFYKAAPNVGISLFYTDTAGLHVFSTENDAPNERLVVTSPEPGIWQLQAINPTDCGRFTAVYEPIEVNPQGYELGLAQPPYEHPPYYDPARPFIWKYQMRDQNGVLVEQHPRFPIQVTAVVTNPDGSRQQFEMVWDNTQRLFLANTPLRLSLSGPYRFVIQGATSSYEGPLFLSTISSTVLFNATRQLFYHDLTYDVPPVIPLIIQIISPHPGNNSGMSSDGATTVLPVLVQLVDNQGHRITDIASIWGPDKTSLTATLQTSTRTQSVPIQFAPDVNLFVGRISSTSAGKPLTLSVVSGESVLSPYQMLQPTDQVYFTPTLSVFYRPVPVSSGLPIPNDQPQNASTPALIGLLLMALVTSILLPLTWFCKRSTPKGKLVFTYAGKPYKEFNLSLQRCRGRQIRIRSRTLRPLHLRSLTVRWMFKPDLSLYMIYKPLKGKTQHQRLLPNQPIPYIWYISEYLEVTYQSLAHDEPPSESVVNSSRKEGKSKP